MKKTFAVPVFIVALVLPCLADEDEEVQTSGTDNIVVYHHGSVLGSGDRIEPDTGNNPGGWSEYTTSARGDVTVYDRDGNIIAKGDKVRDVKDFCWVATVVYGGDENAQQVCILRNFRDEVLSQHFLGKVFIRFYYAGVGKWLADHLPEWAVPPIRACLDKLVEWYQKRT